MTVTDVLARGNEVIGQEWRFPLLALFGHDAMSDLSPLSGV
jgi:hypothetical protein